MGAVNYVTFDQRYAHSTYLVDRIAVWERFGDPLFDEHLVIEGRETFYFFLPPQYFGALITIFWWCRAPFFLASRFLKRNYVA
jgi:hypothetical protein